MAELTSPERKAVNLIIAGLEPSLRDRMLADLALAEVDVLLPDRSMFRFHLPGHSRSRMGQSPLWPEAKIRDQDGEQIDILLYTDADDRLFEFELVRHSPGSVIGPDWSTLDVRS